MNTSNSTAYHYQVVRQFVTSTLELPVSLIKSCSTSSGATDAMVQW